MELNLILLETSEIIFRNRLPQRLPPKTFNVMGGPGSMRKWVSHNPALAGPDHIHFTHKGALEIGNALAKSFILYHDFYKLRQELSDEAVGIYLRDLRDSLNPRPAVPDTLTKTEL